MSSSFVKDCSDVSAPGNANSGKTVIIIVNNETGNVSLDGDELQNLLASHGADGSQVSVVRMGSGGVGNLTEANLTAPLPATGDGTTHVNLTVEGYPPLPLEGQAGNSGNYAELPLDADAFNRLESVLQSEEARKILGEPLIDMVTHPDQLGTLDQLMDSSFFEGGDSEDANLSVEGVSPEAAGSPQKQVQSPPKRRSQRQMDKAEKEEVVKILAENQKKMQEEKQKLNEKQMLSQMNRLPAVVSESEKNAEETASASLVDSIESREEDVETEAGVKGQRQDRKVSGNER